MKGVIKKLNLDKGFGFIKDEEGTERFFHRSSVPRDIGFASLSEGEQVEFDDEEGEKGPRAINVVPIG